MTDINQELEDLKRECSYHEDPDEADFEVDDSVDALIGYKDALEELVVRKAGASNRFARELEGMLYPERFPPDHERHDPDHIYWDGFDPEYDDPAHGEPFQWGSDTIEWVAQAVQRELGTVEA